MGNAEYMGRRGKDRKARRERDALARDQMDFESFLQDLEEDPELRSRVNLYKDEKKLNSQLQAEQQGGNNEDDDDDMLEDDFPEIQMDELLESMQGLQAVDNVEKDVAAETNPALSQYDPSNFANREVSVLAPDYAIIPGAQVVNKS